MKFQILLHELADGALLVEYPDLSDEEANARAVAGARLLERRPPEGLFSAVVGARTLFLEFDPARCASERFGPLLTTRESAQPPSPRRTLRIPVVYGEEAGRDLAELAAEANLSPEDFARRHAAAVYRVAFLGFAPGFAYLTGLPRELQAPRLSTPRPRVAAGTVAIAGPYSGIYPGGTPGGWRSIGWTHVRLFDPAADPPTLFLPGDEVRFERVDSERRLPPLERRMFPQPQDPTAGAALFRVVAPGVFSSVQGPPRFDWSSYGVPPGGAMDWVALARANAMLGNRQEATALEMTLVGAELEVLEETTVCLFGSEAEAYRNGAAVAFGQKVRIDRGDRLRIGRLRQGARAYLAVAGGFATPARFEISPRLVSGDLLFTPLRPLASSSEPLLPSHGQPAPVRSTSVTAEAVVRVVLDPREVPFSQEGVATFLSSTYSVSASSDRRGVRLEGEPVSLSRAADIEPEGTPLGGIQIAQDGMPIVLGPDRPVTGGYARIATVIRADFPLLAQRPPGAGLRFVAVSLADALAARVG